MNYAFFKSQTFDTFIRIIISSLKIRDFNNKMHETWKYVITNIYLFDTKNSKKVISIFRREIHLIENLKTNMFFDNNVINSKKIVFDVTKKFVVINNIDVIIILKSRLIKNVVSKLVYLRKLIIVSIRIKMIVNVHNACLSKNKNFLFEFNNDVIKLIIYAHFVNVFTFSILIDNNKNYSIKIFKNARLDKIIKIDFSNVFQIKTNENVRFLIVKQFKITYRNDWFKKLIFVCVVAYVVVVIISFKIFVLQKFFIIVIEIKKLFAIVVNFVVFNISIIVKIKKIFVINLFSSFEIIFFNDVIIYKSKIIDFFVKTIEKFFFL